MNIKTLMGMPSYFLSTLPENTVKHFVHILDLLFVENKKNTH